jgi:hypothetical protein
MNPGSIRDACLGSAERKRKRAARKAAIAEWRGSMNWEPVIIEGVCWVIVLVEVFFIVCALIKWSQESSARQCPAGHGARLQGEGGTSVTPDPRPAAPESSTRPRRGGSRAYAPEVGRNQPLGQSAGALFRAIRLVESRGSMIPPDGDNGRSIGPYQIHRSYWVDARMPDGCHEDCRRADYAERVMTRYWHRYAPDWRPETLARLHNGGCNNWRGAAAGRYWQDVQHYMNEYPPQTTASVASAEGGSMSLTP